MKMMVHVISNRRLYGSNMDDNCILPSGDVKVLNVITQNEVFVHIVF